MVSPWIVLPLAGLTMLIIAAHVLSVQVSDMHRMRKRLRIANGLIMMFVTAALAYALGGVTLVTDPKLHPAQARTFIIVWVVIVALLTLVVALAIIDALGTAGWGLRTRHAMRKEFRAKLLASAAAKSAASTTPPSGGDAPRG
jgi:hypothetical protein